jgi:hypothetical protein
MPDQESSIRKRAITVSCIMSFFILAILQTIHIVVLKRINMQNKKLLRAEANLSGWPIQCWEAGPQGQKKQASHDHKKQRRNT